MTRRSRKRARTQDTDDAASSPPASRTSSPGPSTSKKATTEREKFDLAYETSTKSDADVLGELSVFPDHTTLEKKIDVQIKNWTSSVYDHYKMPPEIVRSGNDVKYIFQCKRCV